METRQCTNCKEDLPATEKYFQKANNKFGLRSMCKICYGMLRMVQYRISSDKKCTVVGGRLDTEQPKKCRICQNKFPRTIEFFSKNRTCKDGLQAECKSCFNNLRSTYRKETNYKNPNDKENGKKWRQSHKWMLRAKSAKRNAQKKRACPEWADLAAITKIYKDCPDGLTVDHVIPLNGERVPIEVFGETFKTKVLCQGVCGLHVPWNLQYLTQSENSKKHNKLLNEYRYGG